MSPSQRYSRQAVFRGIGAAGQERLSAARAVVIGMGALGTVVANNLARAGVGHLRLVDRDYVELNNLQRQTLYDEDDAREGLPKAAAAASHLRKVNSEIEIEPVVQDVNAASVERLIDGVDLVLDGTDNFETRLLVNEACHKHRKTWIYGGAITDSGMSMNIVPGEGPCFRCLCPEAPPPGGHPTCSSVGVLNMITGIVGCVQSAEAIKILVGSPDVRRSLFVMNVWSAFAQYAEVRPDPGCPVCGEGRYELLERGLGSYTTSLCGRDAVQVVPAKARGVDFAAISEKLCELGTVRRNDFMLTFDSGTFEIRLFKDGRAIIKNVRDANQAKSVYAEYIGD